MVVALFGWIMVASGLVDRPWVNAYKLSLHLSLAIIVYVYLLWTVLMVVQPKVEGLQNSWIRKGAITILIISAIQIFLGGMMSGMKAGLAFPTFPDMKGSYFPALLFDLSNWHWANFEEYDKNPFMATFVQFFHRNVAYILSIVIIWFYIKIRKETISNIFRKYSTWMLVMLIIQVGLGIITIMNCLGKVPVMWGSFHQGGAILLFTTIVMVLYQTKER
jgi:cytochrome c oxidase assembly protein subunit 15